MGDAPSGAPFPTDVLPGGIEAQEYDAKGQVLAEKQETSKCTQQRDSTNA